jgi:hypothetical protein
MNYQEKFEITNNNASYFADQFDILITGYRDDEDERHSYFRKSISKFKGKIYSFDTCENSEVFNYKIETPEGEIIQKVDNKSLIPDLQSLLNDSGFEGARVCVDITTLKHGILFLLVYLLMKEIKPAKLLAAYTEPAEYLKRKKTVIGETEEYELYDKIMGSSKGVPGFVKHQSNRDILLIAPMGFESQRLQTIYENLNPKKLIPIVGFPSFVPGWNLTAIKMNYLVLKGADCCDWVKPCEASSPFEMRNLLNDEFHRYSHQYDIYISPLGTRPHCLGAAIFASQNPSVYLIYDFPVEKKYRSYSVLKANVYDLTKYIIDG